MVVGEGVQRGPPRNRSPLAVSFPHFFSAKRNGVALQRERLPSKPSSPQQRAILLAFCGFAVCLCHLQPCLVASGGLLSLLAQRKKRKKCAKGNLSRRRFPLESFPIGQGAAAPLRSPRGLRGTRDRGRETEDKKSRVFGVHNTATARSFSVMRRRRLSFRQGS